MPVLCNSYCISKFKKKEGQNPGKYIQNARLFCFCTGGGYGKLWPALLKGLGEHQPSRKVAHNALKDTKNNLVRSRSKMGWRKKIVYAVGIV